MLPLVLTPQVWKLPALTLWNEPLGGVDWPSKSSPQHSISPLVVTPQECLKPALTLWKEPLGGVDWP